MQKHIYVEQKGIEEISREDLTLLAILTDLNLDETSDLKGTVHTKNFLETLKTKLTSKFPNFHINVDIPIIIDKNRKDSIEQKNNDTTLMEIVHSQNWSQNDSYMTQEEALSISNNQIGIRDRQKSIFQDNEKITNFEAFQYFTNITELNGYCDFNNWKVGAFKGCVNLKKIELPETLTTIYTTVFDNCISLQKINLKNVVNIEDGGIWQNVGESSSFYGCISLQEVIWPNVAKIGTYAFKNCNKLALTTLPTNLKTLGTGAFSETLCNFISLPESVTTISGFPWANTTGTQTYPLYNSHYISWSGYGEKALGSTALSNSFLDCDNEGNIILKNHQTLSSKAFYNNKNIKTLLGADEIYSYVFYGCTNLKNVKGGTIKNATAVFYGCTGLTEITEDIWNLFTDTIGNETFRNCSNLTTIEIPETICKSENYKVYNIFNGCSNLIEAIINNGGIFGSYGNSSGIFSGCNLTKLTIKNAGIWKKQGQSLWGGTIKEIILPKEFEEFYQNGVIATSRTHKINMNNIKYLNKSANSRNVTSGIPCLKFIEFNKLEYIGNQTFNSINNGLKCIYLNQSSIPSWSGFPILHSNLTQLKFYIPQGMRDSYLADSNWDTISDRIIEVTPEEMEDIKKEYYGVDFFGDKYYDTKRLLTSSSRIELKFEIWNQSNLLGSVSGNGQGGIWQFSQNQFRIFDNIIYATPTNTTSALYGNKHTLIVDNSKLEVNGTSVAHSNTQPFTSTKSFIIGGYYWFRNNTIVKASNATIYSLLWYEEDTLVQAWIGNENGGFDIYADEDIEPQENDRKFNLQDYYDNVEGGGEYKKCIKIDAEVLDDYSIKIIYNDSKTCHEIGVIYEYDQDLIDIKSNKIFRKILDSINTQIKIISKYHSDVFTYLQVSFDESRIILEGHEDWSRWTRVDTPRIAIIEDYSVYPNSNYIETVDNKTFKILKSGNYKITIISWNTASSISYPTSNAYINNQTVINASASNGNMVYSEESINIGLNSGDLITCGNPSNSGWPGTGLRIETN